MLTVNELFAGIGSQSAALERLEIEFKVVGIAEIDKYAIKSYEAIHGATRNYGDISVVEKLDYADFWTYSFPCQDISVAGKQRGINENTRSGLLYQVERLLEVSKGCGELPKYLMLENVKNLVGKQFKPQFDEWIQKLDELGYNTYWKVLNAKNYGIPQNRERVFAISIRKDIDNGYEFPEKFDNGKRLKDILESEVDEKFYLSNDKVNLFIRQGNINPSGHGMNGNVCVNDICNTLTTNKGEGLKILEPQINQIGMLDIRGNEQIKRIYADNGISPTLNTMQGGNRQPKVLINLPCIAASRGRYTSDLKNEIEQNLEINKTGNTNTITSVQKDNYVIEPQYKIRKLTPLECWRLMGFTNEQFYKAVEVNSNSQLYKQAGNSIVVDVLYYLFKNIFIDYISK